MNEFTIKKLDLFDQIIDDRCEYYGVRHTIAWLIDNDFTKADLLEMRFEEEDIDYVLELIKDDVDVEVEG